MIKQLSPAEANKILGEQEDVRLIDVREKWEYETAKIDNSELMPLSEFQNHIPKLKPEDNLIIVCHHGNRSFTVSSFLVQNGFKNVSNLDGGIDAWAQEVDPTIPTY
jgi:rhodanese-related sulfurtransferase